MLEVKLSGEGEVSGFIRDVREDIIMKSFGLIFENSKKANIKEASISRTIIEEWIKEEIKEVGEDHKKLVSLVFERLKRNMLE